MSAARPTFRKAGLAALALACLTHPAAALDLTMSAPIAAVETLSDPVGYMSLPTGPFANGTLPQRRIDGAVDQRAWRLDSATLSLTQLSSPLRSQLEAQGFTILLDCEARACGGFDFRFAIDVMAEPAMHVDLGEFRFLSATSGAEAITLLISRSAASGFVQMTRVGEGALPVAQGATAPAALPSVTPDMATQPQVAPLPEDIAGRLVALGSVPLDDLVFDSGAATLAVGDYATLDQLAAWLRADPARSVVLVGHTDSSGGLAANIALSKQRAASVRQALLRRDVAAGQVVAEGVGPLAPRATNLTDEGRMKNRRVEVVMTSTQ